MAAYTGTGFFINNNGDVATAAHVAVSNDLQVYFKGRWYPAKPVFIDRRHDLAVIKIEAKGTPYLPLVTESANKDILVYGYPDPEIHGWGLHVARGSAMDCMGSLYTTAYICPGNSGSPVYSSKGVLGIVASVYWWMQVNKEGCSNYSQGPTSANLIDDLNEYSIEYFSVGSGFDSNSVVLITGN